MDSVAFIPVVLSIFMIFVFIDTFLRATDLSLCLVVATFIKKMFFNLMFLGVKTGVRDQPLTFHSKVKSSGYSAAAPRYLLCVSSKRQLCVWCCHSSGKDNSPETLKCHHDKMFF